MNLAKEIFCPTEEFRSTLPLSEAGFLDLAKKATNVVERDNRGILRRGSRPEGEKEAFSDERKEALLSFASSAFKINALMSQGRDQFIAAKVAVAYRLAEELFRVDVGKFLSSGLMDFDDWFGNNTTAAFSGVRNVGAALEIFDEDILKGYTEDLYTQEIASGKYEDQKLLEEIKRSSLHADSKSLLPVVHTKRLLEDIHAVRTSLRTGIYIDHYAHQHTYIPLAAPIYTLAKAMSKETPLEDHELRELIRSEWNLTYGEIPPAGVTTLDARLRSYWSRLGTIVRDYNLLIQFPHVFAVGEMALSHDGLQPYASRMEASFHLTDPDNLLRNLGLLPEDPLLQTDTPDRRPDKEPDSLVIAARSMCFTNPEIAKNLGTSLFSTRLVDYLLQKADPEAIMQEFSTKGVRSFLENAMAYSNILNDLAILNEWIDGYFQLPTSKHDFNNPVRALAMQSRFWACERLLRFPGEGNSPNGSNLYQKIINGQEYLPKFFPRLAKETKDLWRTRIYTTKENIDEICRRVLETRNASCTLYLEVMHNDGSTAIQRMFHDDMEPLENGIGKTLDDWYSKYKGAPRVFGAAVIRLEHYFYDQKEFQIIPVEHIVSAWESRRTYKLTTRV